MIENNSDLQFPSLNNILEPNSLFSTSKISFTELQSFANFGSKYQLAIDSSSHAELLAPIRNDLNEIEQFTTQGSNDALTGLSNNATYVSRVDSLTQRNDRLSTIAPASIGTLALGTYYVPGTLGADRFTINSNYNYIISGNGNANFGSGLRDYIDLTGINSSSVAFNYASPSGTGGILYNLGNGTRLFDAITLNNGSQILFEGVDQIRFANTTVNLFTTANDPLFNSQWNLHMMGVHNAWDFTKGSTNVMLGVQDSGLGVNSSGSIHPDLRSTSTIIYPNNYYDEFSDTRFPVNQRS